MLVFSNYAKNYASTIYKSLPPASNSFALMSVVSERPFLDKKWHFLELDFNECRLTKTKIEK